MYQFGDTLIVSKMVPLVSEYKAALRNFVSLPGMTFDDQYCDNAIKEIDEFEHVFINILVNKLKPVLGKDPEYLKHFHQKLILKFPMVKRKILRDPRIAEESDFDYYLLKMKYFFDHLKNSYKTQKAKISKLVLRPLERKKFSEMFTKDQIGDNYDKLCDLFDNEINFDYDIPRTDPNETLGDLYYMITVVEDIQALVKNCSEEVQRSVANCLINYLPDEALYRIRKLLETKTSESEYIPITNQRLTMQFFVYFIQSEKVRIPLNRELSSVEKNESTLKKLLNSPSYDMETDLEKFVRGDKIVTPVPDTKNLFVVGDLCSRFIVSDETYEK